MERDPIYLGDGVYAFHDGWNIWLRTERDGRIHEIALEGSTLQALNEYRDRIRGDL